MAILLAEQVGCTELLYEPACAGGDVVEILSVLDEDDELVASHPRDRIALPRLGSQAIGHLAQQYIPDFVAQRVVDDFEAVQVHKQNGQFGANPTVLAQCSVEALIQHQAIRKGSQIVMKGDVMNSIVGTPPLLKYAHRQHGAETEQRGRCGEHDGLQPLVGGS